jgi:hypothetical protein
METKNKKSICVVCGSQNAEQKENNKTMPVPYSPAGATYKQKVVCCADCGAEIDGTEDEEIKAALDTARQESITAMLGYFKSEGYSLAEIERSLDLPQRTISRWKGNGELSSVGMALLRIIRTYPWIMDVAEHKYEQYYACETLIVNAVQVMTSLASYRLGLPATAMGGSLMTQSKYSGEVSSAQLLFGVAFSSNQSHTPKVETEPGFRLVFSDETTGAKCLTA